MRLSIPAGSRVDIQLAFDGSADEARLAAAQRAIEAWLAGAPLVLPDGVHLMSALPAADVMGPPVRAA
jgi:hypothetical protein